MKYKNSLFLLLYLLFSQSANGMIEKLFLVEGKIKYDVPGTIVIVGFNAEDWVLEDCFPCAVAPSGDDMKLDGSLALVLKALLDQQFGALDGKDMRLDILCEARESKKSPQFPLELLSFYRRKMGGNGMCKKGVFCHNIWDEDIETLWRALYNPRQIKERLESGRVLESIAFDTCTQAYAGKFEEFLNTYDILIEDLQEQNVLPKKLDEKNKCKRQRELLADIVRNMKHFSKRFGPKKCAFLSLRRKLKPCNQLMANCGCNCDRCRAFETMFDISCGFWASKYFVDIFDLDGDEKVDRKVVLLCEHTFGEHVAEMFEVLGYKKTAYSFRSGVDKARRLAINPLMIPFITKCFVSGATGFCDECGKVASKKCSVCKCAVYCSRECQKANWKLHKKYCKLFEKALLKKSC